MSVFSITKSGQNIAKKSSGVDLLSRLTFAQEAGKSADAEDSIRAYVTVTDHATITPLN